MHVLRPILPLNLALALQAVAFPAAQPRTTLNFVQSYGVPGVNASFDFLVVGGGTAGLAIASRLAADPSISVAVIEAGGFYEANGNLSVVPGYCTFHAGTDPADTDLNVDWGFVTVPQAVGVPGGPAPEIPSAYRLFCREPIVGAYIMLAARHWEGLRRETSYTTTGKRQALHRSGQQTPKTRPTLSITFYHTTRKV